MRLERQRARPRLETGPEGSRAADQQPRVRPPPAHDRHRVEQGVETHAGFEVPHRQQQRPLRGKPQARTDATAVRARPESLGRHRAADRHDALPRHRVELPQLFGREIAEHVDERRAAQARTLDRPQHRDAGRTDHPTSRAILERRRRVEAVETREPAAGLRGERAVAGQRLVDVQDIDRLAGELVRDRVPGPEDRAANEPRDRPLRHRELADADPLALERDGRRHARVGAAHHPHVVTARGQVPRLLPEHPLAATDRLRRRHVGDHENAQGLAHRRLTGASTARDGRGTHASTAPPSSGSRGDRRGPARRGGAPA